MTRRLLLFSISAALFACGGGGNDFDETALFFDETVLHEVELLIDPSFFPQLESRDEVRVPCDIIFDGIKVRTAGIRLKGNLGSVVGQTLAEGKPSFSIKVNEFVQGNDILGVKKFTLDNSVQDLSLLSAFLGHEIFRRAGVPTSRVAYARVSVNGEYFGVYVMVESYNTDFLERHFTDGSGNLYEGPGDLLGVNELDLDSNQEINDRSDLEALADVLINSPNDQLIAAVSNLVDMEEFLTYWAVEELTYHWDGFATFGSPFGPCCSPNNYNIYHDPSLDKFYLLPHGIDSLFLDVDFPVLSPPSPGSSLPARLFAHEEIRQRLADKIREVLETAWDTEALEERLDNAIQLIRPSVLEFDRNPFFNVNEFEATIEARRDFIRRRPQAALERLDQLGL